MKKWHSLFIAFIIFLLFVVCKSSSPMGHNSFFVDKDKCTGCKSCIRVCPVDAIRIIDNKAYIDPKRCIQCGNCIEECPEDAIF